MCIVVVMLFSIRTTMHISETAKKGDCTSWFQKPVYVQIYQRLKYLDLQRFKKRTWQLSRSQAKKIDQTEHFYLGHSFHMYENQGCDICCKDYKSPYLPPMRGIHVTYSIEAKSYLCGYCLRARIN